MDIRRLYCFFLLVSLVIQPVSAQENGQQSPAAGEIENVISTLEDPSAREDLISDLRTIMAARRENAGGQQEVPDVSGLWQWIKDSIRELWDAVTEIDPRQVLISSLMTIAVILGILACRWLILRGLVKLYTRLTERDKQSEVTAELPPTVKRSVTLILLVAGLVLIAESWGADFGKLFKTDMGSKFVEMLLSIGFIVVITIVLLNAANIIVERTFRAHSHRIEHERRARRLESLIPLLRSIIQITITILACLLILSELGINIGPLLAGAGILGLAVGFGAQSLVKDLITGVIILLEDGASVEDIIEVGSHFGKVEEMRIRVIQLRDLAGIVHMIPYSDVSAIKNYTKDFSYYLFDVGVAYREDADEVIKVLKELSEEICGDEEYKDMILEPLDILGVDQFADSAVIIKARFKTTPKERWTVGREFNRRIKKRFDELGIEIPFPHRTVYFGEPKTGQAPPVPLAFADQTGALLERLGEKTRG